MTEYTVCAKCKGKVHLIGEHSVVYFEPAIIAAINRDARVDARYSDQIIINAVNLGRKESYTTKEIWDLTSKMNQQWEDCSKKQEKDKFKVLRDSLKEDKMNPVKVMVGKSLEQLHIEHGVDLKINSEIPIGAGLGSSAALSVVIPAAISEVYGKHLSRDEVNVIAKENEKINHGSPSGGDNYTCCYGGLVWFQKPSTAEVIEEVPVLENFVIVKTGKTDQAKKEPEERSTSKMIDTVASLSQEYRDPRIKLLGTSAYKMREALGKKDFKSMKDLMNLAHQTLAELHVSTDEMDSLNKKVREIGGAIKITGAGGPGSCMIGYHEKKDELLDLLVASGYEPWEVKLGVDGLRTERIA